MKILRYGAAIGVILTIGMVVYFTQSRPAGPGNSSRAPGETAATDLLQKSNPITSQNMQITSPAFRNNEEIPESYTCDGTDISPPLAFADVPSQAKSLALIVDDPDAPVGDWVHWLVWNIKPDSTGIAENSVPDGSVQGTTDFGKPGWGGPCPPSGVHHYQFKLYALDAKIELPASAKKADLEKAIGPHTLASAALVGLYQKR